MFKYENMTDYYKFIDYLIITCQLLFDFFVSYP